MSENNPEDTLKNLTPQQVEQFDYMKHMIDNPEELDPELAACLTEYGHGPAIKHPLINEIFYMPQVNPRYNEQLRRKKRDLEQAKAERAWFRFIVLHERPWRAEAFVEVADEMTDDEYWDELGDVWIDTENLWQWHHLVEELMLSDRPGRENLMDESERTFLAALPDELRVFRGHNEHNQFGWSWSLDPEKAMWFARRFASLSEEPAVSMATVSKEAVIAVFMGRNESEVVLDPHFVEVTACTEIGEDDEPTCECGMPTSLSAQDENHGQFHRQQTIVSKLKITGDADITT